VDKAFWQAILDADGAVPQGYTVTELTPELLRYLGTTDPFLRDEVAFEMLAAWIVRDQRYSPDEMRALGDQLARNLETGLGEQDTNSVFLRSFSALVLDKVIEADNWHACLEAADIRRWMEQGLAYIVAECDLRGRVPDQGWAHAIAHAADLLWVLAQSRHLAAPDLERILDAIAKRITTPVDHVYLYNEDQRLAFAAMGVLQRDLLDLPTVDMWLGRMLRPDHDWQHVFQSTDTASAYHNTTTFLRSLYFQLLIGINPPAWYPDKSFFERVPALRDQLLPRIVGALKTLDRGFYAKDGL
jgi:hypothetical protein